MSEVAAVEESGAPVEVCEFPICQENIEETEEPISNKSEPPSHPRETIQRMKAEESLQKAIMPNLREMGRVEEIKKELTHTDQLDKRFYLYKELFSLQFQAYQKSKGESSSLFILQAQKAYQQDKDERSDFVLLSRQTRENSSRVMRK